jgi:hypothetical protein
MSHLNNLINYLYKYFGVNLTHKNNVFNYLDEICV